MRLVRTPDPLVAAAGTDASVARPRPLRPATGADVTDYRHPVRHGACAKIAPLMVADADDHGWFNFAVAVCHSCSELRACREWATQVPDPVPYHVAGGLAPWERPGATARALWNARRKLNITAVKAS